MDLNRIDEAAELITDLNCREAFLKQLHAIERNTEGEAEQSDLFIYFKSLKDKIISLFIEQTEKEIEEIKNKLKEI